MIYTVDFGEYTKKLTASKIYRFWRVNKDTIGQGFESWLYDMNKQGLVVRG